MTIRLISHTLDLYPWAVQKAEVMVCPAHSSRIVRIAAVLCVALVLAGCAAMQQTVGGWFGKATPTSTPTPQVTPAAAAARRVYYAGVEGLKVYSQPAASSKVVGALALHEEVTRTKLERGYAYVESAQGAVKGWVNNAQLIWRLPTAPGTAAPAPAEPQPEGAAAPAEAAQESPAIEPTATATEPLPEPTNTPLPAPPKSQATPVGVAPSIFNP